MNKYFNAFISFSDANLKVKLNHHNKEKEDDDYNKFKKDRKDFWATIPFSPNIIKHALERYANISQGKDFDIKELKFMILEYYKEKDYWIEFKEYKDESENFFILTDYDPIQREKENEKISQKINDFLTPVRTESILKKIKEKK